MNRRFILSILISLALVVTLCGVQPSTAVNYSVGGSLALLVIRLWRCTRAYAQDALA